MYLLTDMMRMKCTLYPKNLCTIRSSCTVSEGFKYPVTMTKTAPVKTMDCSSFLDESQQCLIEHMNGIAKGATPEYLASSSVRCFDLIDKARKCMVSSPSSDEIGKYVFEFESKKKVRFDIPEEDEESFDDDNLEIPMPLVDLTQIYGPDAKPQIDTSVECVTIRGKTYCEVKEMNM